MKSLIRIFNNIFIIPYKSKIIYWPIDKTLYYKDNINNFSLDWVYIWSIYDKNIQKDLKNFKYRYNTKSLQDFVKIYIRLIWDYIREDKENLIITWMPIYILDRLFRTYNHTYKLCNKISSDTGIRFKKLVKKIKHTKKQARLNKNQRAVNIKWCFKSINQIDIKWKNIIIIDDIISTWNTSHEIWKILKECWANKVYWLFLASYKNY